MELREVRRPHTGAMSYIPFKLTKAGVRLVDPPGTYPDILTYTAIGAPMPQTVQVFETTYVPRPKPPAMCLLDMDGVIVDFLGACSRAHNRPLPYSDPVNLGVWETEKCWGITAEEFWKPCRGYDFWVSLEKTPEADRIVDTVTTYFGEENVAILTAPSEDVECIPAKQAWISRYYPHLSSRMIFGKAKQFLAAPNHVLVDDRDKNAQDFVLAGGHAVIVPRLWNSAFRYADLTAKVVSESVYAKWEELTNGL